MAFTFERGKKYALVGSNGAGKSIILKSVANLIEPEKTSGDIYIDEKKLADCDVSNVLWMIDQHEHIFQDDFIKNTTVYGSFAYSEDRIRTLLEKCSHVPEKIRFLKNREQSETMSGGEKQLIACLRAILAEKEILLFDESFSAMDVNIANEMKQVVSDFTNKTILFVTHEISEHLNNYDTVLVMKKGKLVCSGKWENVKQYYQN